MNELETLKFTLAEKNSKLSTLSVNTFTLNAEIGELVAEIKDLQDKIAQLEGKEE